MRSNGAGERLQGGALYLIFYAIFVPLGLALRLIRYDPLRLRYQAGGPVWLLRNPDVAATHYDRPS